MERVGLKGYGRSKGEAKEVRGREEGKGMEKESGRKGNGREEGREGKV